MAVLDGIILLEVVALVVEQAAADGDAGQAACDCHVAVDASALVEVDLLGIGAEVLGCQIGGFDHGRVNILRTGGNIAVLDGIPGDGILAPACSLFVAGFLNGLEDAVVQLFQQFCRVGAEVELDGGLGNDGVDACIVACVEVGNAEGGLGILGNFKVGNLGNSTGCSVEGVGHQAECAVGVAADAVEVDLIGLEAGGFKGDALGPCAVNADGAFDIGVMIEEILHAAQRAHALFTGCADKDDIALGLQAGSLEAAECRQQNGQTACIVNDTGCIEDAVLTANFLDAALGEYGVQMGFNEDLGAGACTLPQTDGIAELVHMGIFQAQLAQIFGICLGAFGFLEGGSFDEGQRDLIFDRLLGIGFDEGHGLLYFIQRQNLVKQGLYLGVYLIIHNENLRFERLLAVVMR